MKKVLSFVKPDVQNVELKNRSLMSGTEKVRYLNVPENLSLKALKGDIRLGAVQFKELVPLVEKENTPQYILITAENEESGYQAVTYLAGALNRKCGKVYDPDECITHEDEDGDERWVEDAYRIPIISKNDLEIYMNRGDNSFPFANQMFVGQQRSFIKPPFWTECKSEAICILTDGGICSSFMGREDVLSEGLDVFCDNTQIYILNIERPCRWGGFFGDMDEDGEGEDFTDMEIRPEWNSIVLNYAADEASVKLPEAAAKKYYQKAIFSIAAEKGLVFEAGFRFQSLVNKVITMRDENKCGLIDNLINYAVKDKPKDYSELKNKDFDFMDRFIRAGGFAGSSGKKDSRKAIEILRNDLIGMDNVKEQVLNVVNVMKYNRMRAEMKIPGSSYHNVHVMLGAPGTAKTTVAQLMGRIMMEEKLLPDDRYICINGAELKGKYVGHSAPKTKEIFESHDIIVIDEAYSLVGDNGEMDIFSKESIAQLIIELENHSTDKLVIFAGYGGKKVSERNNKMKDFLDANPGIKSRITSTIYFDSYSPQEMVSIFYKIADNQKYRVSPGAGAMLEQFFGERMLDQNFGNGREARSLLETAVIYAAKRVFAQNKKKYTKEDMQEITCEDVQSAVEYMRNANDVQNARAAKAIGFGCR